MPSNYFSSLGSAFKREVQRSVLGKGGGMKETRLLHSAPCFCDLHVLIQPGAVVATQSNLHLLNRRRNLTMAGALSRSFSIPSVSGPSFQVCGYHIDELLSKPSPTLCSTESCRTPVAVCGSHAIVGDRSLNSLTSKLGHLKVTPNDSATFDGSMSSNCCRKTNIRLMSKEYNRNCFVYGSSIYNTTQRGGSSVMHVGSGLKSYHSTSLASSPAETAPDVCFDSSGHEEKFSNAAVSSGHKDLADRTLKLVSASCYLPHPDKEETGGEDAHFICADEQVIGVADGVGGWAEVGIDSGLFSRELMSHSVDAIREESEGSIDPARVLEKAHSCTKSRGSSTACIIALTAQGIKAINLGDSGFIVVRNGCTVFRSPVQQHDFNLTFQLESGNEGDLPSSGQVFTIPVAPGDVLVAGTDGLFDNLYNNEVTGVVVEAMRAGFAPQVTAQKIAALARQRALDKNRQTPFSTAAQDAGIRYYGGKLDDITVVVSYITSINKE